MDLTERYNNYLGTYYFNSNCIEFRIQSAKAIEKFMNVQAFQLNQLVNGKFYFAQDRREILLLKYDMWFRWLIEIENFFIELCGSKSNQEKTTSKKDLEFIIKLADKTSKSYHNVILNVAPERFEEQFVKIWLKIHSFSYNYMIEELKDLEHLSFAKAFNIIVDILVYVMQYTLIEIYELDSLFCQKISECEFCEHGELCPKNKRDEHDQIPFLIIGPISKNCIKNSFKCLPIKRLIIYKEYFDIKEIYFKNYTDEPISNDIVKMINSTGVEINFKKSIVK